MFIFVSKYGVNEIGTNFRLVHPLVAVHIAERRKIANLAISQELVDTTQLVFGLKDAEAPLSYLF